MRLEYFIVIILHYVVNEGSPELLKKLSILVNILLFISVILC